MRAEPSSERVQLLRAVPPPADAPALRRANPQTYEDETVDQEQGSGGFIRLFVFLIGMCVLGVTLAIGVRVIGSSGARLAFASSASSATAANDPAMQLDRMAKEL